MVKQSIQRWDIPHDQKNVIHHLLPGIHLYIGSNMRSFLCSFIHSLTQFIFFDSFIIHPLLHPFIHSFMNSFIHSCVLSFSSMNHALEGLSQSLDVLYPQLFWETSVSRGRNYLASRYILYTICHFPTHICPFHVRISRHTSANPQQG